MTMVGYCRFPPRCVSLLDKYASINTSIDDARRRVTEIRSKLDQSNLKIQNLCEERNSMKAETEQANRDKLRLLAQLKEAKERQSTKQMERDRLRRDRLVAKSEYDNMRRHIEDARMDFLERCREFRSSCKRLRVASSILVLDGGGDFKAKDDTDEVDLWRRLQDDDIAVDVNSEKDWNDLDIELAEKNEKESRQELMEAQTTLHAESLKYEDAIKRCNARNQRLSQQRAQLQRHRNEVQDLEQEIQEMKDNIVGENQLAHTFEKGKRLSISLSCSMHSLMLTILFCLMMYYSPVQNATEGSKSVITKLFAAIKILPKTHRPPGEQSSRTHTNKHIRHHRTLHRMLQQTATCSPGRETTFYRMPLTL